MIELFHQSIRHKRLLDLKAGHGEVYLPGGLARKWPKAGREWAWHWVVPSEGLSVDPRGGKMRRHHVSETGIQAALKAALWAAEVHKPPWEHVHPAGSGTATSRPGRRIWQAPRRQTFSGPSSRRRRGLDPGPCRGSKPPGPATARTPLSLLDWLVQLPKEQEIEFRRQVAEYEAHKHMPYITSIERLGREEGRREGRQEGLVAARQKAVLDALEIRFGQVPDGIRERIEAIQDEPRLRVLLKSAIQAGSIEEFIRTL